MRLSNRDVRLGDAERQDAARALGEHLRAGRLSLVEYDERAARAYAARTNGDLRPLFADLPRPPSTVTGVPTTTELQALARRVFYRVQLAGLGVVVALVALIVLAAHAPMWVIAGPAVLLGLRWWRRPSRRAARRAAAYSRPYVRR